MRQIFKHYTRKVDAGHGTQDLMVDGEGIVLSQELNANRGYYTGYGNPEYIGETIRYVNKSAKEKFIRIHMSDDAYLNWIEN